MRLLVACLCAGLFMIVPGIAWGKSPTPVHRSQYLKDYYKVQHKFGHRAPGRQIVRWGFDAHHKATDAQVVTSIGVLERMLTPPPPPPPTVPAVQTTPSSTSTITHTATDTSSSTPSGGGLVSCIIQNESGGDPQAVSGQYSGIGQWNAAAWQQDGGTKYSSSPTGATYQQQYQVLVNEGAAQQIQQQGQFDRCA